MSHTASGGSLAEPAAAPTLVSANADIVTLIAEINKYVDKKFELTQSTKKANHATQYLAECKNAYDSLIRSYTKIRGDYITLAAKEAAYAMNSSHVRSLYKKTLMAQYAEASKNGTNGEIPIEKWNIKQVFDVPVLVEPKMTEYASEWHIKTSHSCFKHKNYYKGRAHWTCNRAVNHRNELQKVLAKLQKEDIDVEESIKKQNQVSADAIEDAKRLIEKGLKSPPKQIYMRGYEVYAAQIRKMLQLYDSGFVEFGTSIDLQTSMNDNDMLANSYRRLTGMDINMNPEVCGSLPKAIDSIEPTVYCQQDNHKLLPKTNDKTEPKTVSQTPKCMSFGISQKDVEKNEDEDRVASLDMAQLPIWRVRDKSLRRGFTHVEVLMMKQLGQYDTTGRASSSTYSVSPPNTALQPYHESDRQVYPSDYDKTAEALEGMFPKPLPQSVFAPNYQLSF